MIVGGYVMNKTSWRKLFNENNIFHYLIDNKDEIYSLPTYEGEDVEIRADRLLINLIILSPLHRRGVLPTKNSIYLEGTYTVNECRAQENGVIFHPEFQNCDSEEFDKIKTELFYDVDRLSDIIATELAAEFRSISMVEISRTMQNPEVQKVITFDCDRFLSQSLKSLESAIEKHNKTIISSLKRIEGDNCFRPFLLTGCLNEGQFFQSVCLGGTRTDVDDTAVTYPIKGNYINGLRGNIEYIIESFSAKKSDDYNKDHMGDASYTKRKINLMASSIQHIYQGDCGSDRYIIDVVPEEQIEGHLGRRILDDDDKEIILTHSNIRNYIDKPIRLFSPITCNHVDGICQKCGGYMLKLLPPNVKLGQMSTEQVMNPLQQSILSSKHLMKTLILMFGFPEELYGFFDIKDNNIYFEETGHNNKLMIGVPTEGVQNISELGEFEGESIPGSYYSAIPSIAIANNETGEIYVPPTSVENESKIIPYFTSEFLEFLKDHRENIIYNGEMVWFSLKGFDTDQPIMGITYVSEAAYVFIKRIENFFSRTDKKGGISRYKDASIAIRDLRNLLWKRIKCNSLHIETLIRSAMITSENDMSIPKCYDPGGIMFGQMPQINMYRSISTEAAFERWREYTQDPKAYVTVTKTSIFDPYIGPDDILYPDKYK